MGRTPCSCHVDMFGASVQCGECVRRERLIQRNKTYVSPHRIDDRQVAGMRRLLAKYRHASQTRGYEWRLSEQEAFDLFASDCFYCGSHPVGRDLRLQKRYRNAFVASGIDRIDNRDGYTPLNTVACCGICNRAKHAMSLGEFTEWAVRFARHTLKDEGVDG